MSGSTFELVVEETRARCPVGERYAEEQQRAGRIPVLSCEGPCIRGEIARQAAHLIGKDPRFARACQGEAVTVPDSAMARWIRDAPRVLVVDGCFLHCQARLMHQMVVPERLVKIDALQLYRKYTDLFGIDDVPEVERRAVAQQVADGILAKFSDQEDGACDKAAAPSPCGAP